MSTRRIAVNVSRELASKMKKAAGKIPVSTWAANVITEHLNDTNLQQQWESFCADVRPSTRDRAKAHAIFRRLTWKRRSTKYS